MRGCNNICNSAKQAIYERDRTSGMTSVQIKERDEARLQAITQGRPNTSTSASPQKDFKWKI